MIRMFRLMVFVLVALPIVAFAEDAPAKAAQQSMRRFVAGQMVNGTYYFYDPLERKLLALRFNKIHEEVRREGTFLVSCSHFTDQFERSVDLDFLVLPKDSEFVTTQAIIHDVDGRARPYDLKLKTQAKWKTQSDRLGVRYSRKRMSGPELHLVRAPRELPDGIDELLDAGYRYALSLTHDAAEAEDVVQDAALALLASSASWERLYFLVTIRNRFIDRYRRSRKVLFVALDEHEGSSGEAVDFSWETRDVLESGLLERALAKLRVDEREALFLAVVEGYTAEEIGRMTDRPRGTILSLLHRAKKKLREIIGGDVGVLK